MNINSSFCDTFLTHRIFFSSVSALVIYSCYIAGYIVAWLLIRYKKKTGLFVQRLNSFCHDRFLIKSSLKHSCSICDNLSCKRHLQSVNLTPWKHLYISKDLDDSVEHVSSSHSNLLNLYLLDAYFI